MSSIYGAFGTPGSLPSSGNYQDMQDLFSQDQQPLGQFTGMAQNIANQQVNVGGFDPFGNNNQTEQRQLSGPEQIRAGGMADYMNFVNANQMNYQNVMGGIQGFQDAITGGAEDIRQSGIDAQQDLYGFAEGLQDLGQQQYENVEGRVDEAIGGFEDLSAQQASSISAGLAMRNRSQRSNLESASKMGDPNAQAALSQFELDSNAQTAQTMSSLASQYNQGLAGMRMQGAQTLNQAAATQQGFESIAAGLNSQGAAIAQSAAAQAANMEAQGMGTVAGMIAANPYNPVAFLSTLMTMFQFDQTPGSGGFSGFSNDLLFS